MVSACSFCNINGTVSNEEIFLPRITRSDYHGYISVTVYDGGLEVRCLLLISRSTCLTHRTLSHREDVWLQPGSQRVVFCVGVGVRLAEGPPMPALAFFAEWLVFIKVEKERLFKSHANPFESRVHKSYTRNLFQSPANHLESCESFRSWPPKHVQGLWRPGCRPNCG